jgi:hypothetical protein
LEPNKFYELIQLATNSDMLVHQQVHNAVLRQLVDAAQLSNHPFNSKPWEKEIDFD